MIIKRLIELDNYRNKLIMIKLVNVGERNNERSSSSLNFYSITNKTNKRPINMEEKNA